jgi:hypothetical protein
VPVFSFRFRADDEELEEIFPNAEETDDDGEKKGIICLWQLFQFSWLDGNSIKTCMCFNHWACSLFQLKD